MENRFSFNEKPLAFWMVQMLSEDVTERNQAAQAFEVLSNPKWELVNPDDADRWSAEEKVCSERFWTEFRRVLRNNEAIRNIERSV